MIMNYEMMGKKSFCFVDLYLEWSSDLVSSPPPWRPWENYRPRYMTLILSNLPGVQHFIAFIAFPNILFCCKVCEFNLNFLKGL